MRSFYLRAVCLTMSAGLFTLLSALLFALCRPALAQSDLLPLPPPPQSMEVKLTVASHAVQSTTQNQPASAWQGSSRQDLNLKYRRECLLLQGTLFNELTEGAKPTYNGRLNQAYWEGSFADGQLGFMAGKRVIAWGAGQGFRPLDVVQRENRQDISPPTPEGVWVVGGEYLNATQAVSFLWINPDKTQHGLLPVNQITNQTATSLSETIRQEPALAVRAYQLWRAQEFFAVARLTPSSYAPSNTREWGLGWNGVLGDEWGMYAAYVRQQRDITTQTAQQTTVAGATTQNTVDKWLLGVQYTHPVGMGVLWETWHNGEAWVKEGSVPVSEMTRKLQTNHLLRFSWDDVAMNYELSALHTPDNGRTVWTVAASWQGNQHFLRGGLRHYGRSKDENTNLLLPTQQLWWLECQWAL